ncbi:MAG TPA: SDR family NAD(P)-dependent oxidoreductase, partial [Actinomycetota bacterium]|nr:SDR family NAD(P)-dependent oxidoreductase [Actinomycetota bacterium]
MEPVLEGRRSLIVGGGGEGIGRAITQAFIAAGSAVAVVDLDPRRADQAAAAAVDADVPGFAIPGDVRSTPEIDG